jgi:FtsP/CotA-like multicopper oxidase with cupredoxin domain
LPVATSIQFPGQDNVTSNGAPVGPVADPSGNLLSLVPEAVPSGSVSYSFTAGHAGTYLYESGSDPQLQVQMGLFGAIVVRPVGVSITVDDLLAIPADGPTGVTTNAARGMTADDATNVLPHAACAYASTTLPGKCDPLAIYDTSRENILMLSEVDPGLHSFMEQHKGTATMLTWNGYPGAYEAHYFMINGRSMPDTIAPNNAPWLPGQPYGALATVQPWDAKVNPLDAMLRYVGVGITGYDFHPHSNHEHVIAEDGALMKGTSGNDNTEEKFNIMVAPGSTVDATFRWTNEEGYSNTDGHRLPVTWPNGLNLSEGDFWSGSPYLGESGQLNPGILGKTQCGEYYHVAHSHDLTQATNYGITFGGMLTLIKVEPPENVQATLTRACE